MPMLPSGMRAQPEFSKDSNLPHEGGRPEFSKESKLPHDSPTPFPSRSRRRPTMTSRPKVQSEESKMLIVGGQRSPTRQRAQPNRDKKG